MRISDWSSDVCSSDLLIGDGVEGLAGLLHSLNLLNDRMAGGEGIQRHGLFLAVDLVEFDMPFGVEMRGRLALHPASEAFLEPKVVPPGHSHQIAEPTTAARRLGKESGHTLRYRGSAEQ